MTRIKKLSLAVLIAIFAASIIIFATFNMAEQNSAIAVTQPTTNIDFQIKVNENGVLSDAEKDENGNTLLVAGQTITLIATFSSEYEDMYWYAISVYMGALVDGETAFSTDIAKYLSIVKDPDTGLTATSKRIYFANDEGRVLADPAQFATVINDNFNASGALLMGLGVQGEYTLFDTSYSCVMELDILIDSEIAADTLFNLTVRNVANNYVSYSDSDQGSLSTIDERSSLKVEGVPVKIREKSSDATLKELTVGHTEALKTFASAEDAEFKISATAGEMTYSSDSEDLTDFSVTPTANDKYIQKIEVSLSDFDTATADEGDTDSSDTEAVTVVSLSSGESTTLTLNAGANTLYVRVTAETGATLTYTVSITMAYVRLSNITATSTTPTNGVTKNGLSTTYDKETYSYTVYVPDDYTKCELSATILADYDSNKNISVVCSDNCTIDATTFESDDVIEVTFTKDSEDPYTVDFTATASDGSSTQKYSLNFQFVSVSTEITVKVTGSSSGNEISYDTEQSNTDKYEYFYSLKDETEGKAKIELTTKAGQVVTIDGEAYEGEGEYEEGIYKVEVEAEAGNKLVYTITLGKSVYLRLAEDATCDFIVELEVDEDGELLKYRRTYAYLGWTHGYNDADLDIIVLGQIVPSTTVSDFLKFIDESQVNQIILYNNYNEEVYNCGEVGEDIEEEEYFGEYPDYWVGTGWYLKFNEEIVYISVLADIDGDGIYDTIDSSAINNYLMDITYAVNTFKSVYVRLAAYVVNSGSISTLDSSIINTMLTGKAKLETFLVMPEKEDEDEE